MEEKSASFLAEIKVRFLKIYYYISMGWLFKDSLNKILGVDGCFIEFYR